MKQTQARKRGQKRHQIPLIVIVGPTATGKSDLAVRIARNIQNIQKTGVITRPRNKKPLGEVISADSRQVYKGLNIGTGKITKREMKGVAHHLLDVADPRIPANSPRRFNVEKWRSLAAQAIEKIRARGHVPIICGGTGFYIEALVDGITLPDVPSNPQLRRTLEKKSASELFNILKKLDPRRAREMLGTKSGDSNGIHGTRAHTANGDFRNPRRLIRAIEIATALGAVPAAKKISQSASPYAPIFIGLTLPPEELKKKIEKRLHKRIAAGMINEARKLHKPLAKNGGNVSWKRMNELGLEYRYLALYLQNKISKDEMTERLSHEIWHYARRQMAWFRRDKRIIWFTTSK